VKKVVFLFPGQGSQAIGMGKDFFYNFSFAKEMFELASDKIKIDFKKLLFEDNTLLSQTKYTQPAIFLVSAIAKELFKKETQITPIFALGHSLGEFSALYSAGALDFGDGIELVHHRGIFMEEACKGKEAGMMAVLGLEDEVVENICTTARNEGLKIWAANYNCDGQIVVAGIKKDIQKLSEVFKNMGARRAVILNMSVASHSPLLEDAREKLREFLQKYIKDSFEYEIISNVSAKPYSSKEEAVRLLDLQLVKPVLYKHSLKNIEEEIDVFIELGHGNILRGLNRKITKKPTFGVMDTKSLNETIKKVA
jgi:[acyl-carrier-protein] S-malonyltransferase